MVFGAGLCAGLLLLGTGCGKKSNVSLQPVIGKVTLDGDAVPGAMVTFIPVPPTPGNGGGATTAPDGSYEVIGRDGKGLPAGAYKVTVSLLLKKDGSPADRDVPPIMSDGWENIPAQYSDAEKTILKVNVGEGEKKADLPLKSEKKKKK